jgi:hypothetical protein
MRAEQAVLYAVGRSIPALKGLQFRCKSSSPAAAVVGLLLRVSSITVTSIAGVIASCWWREAQSDDPSLAVVSG